MKPKLSTLLLVSGAALAVFGSQANAQTVLFADTFNRANNNNLSADTTGMSGTLGALGYLETWQGGTGGNPANNDSILQINNNTLSKIGSGMGMGGVNHNFIDPAIIAAGGFKVSLDITSVSGSGNDLPDRFGGFGVGLSLAKVNAFQDENDTNLGPRGTISSDANVVDQAANGHTGVADFYVSLSIQNNVQVFAGGLLVNQFAVNPTGSHTLEADFTFPDFNAGSLVNYSVKFEGNPVTTGTFNWSSTDNNYVGFSLRAATVTVDNLAISTVPEPSTAALLLLGTAGLLIRRRRV